MKPLKITIITNKYAPEYIWLDGRMYSRYLICTKDCETLRDEHAKQVASIIVKDAQNHLVIYRWSSVTLRDEQPSAGEPVFRTCLKCRETYEGKEGVCPSCGYDNKADPDHYRPEIIDYDLTVYDKDGKPVYSKVETFNYISLKDLVREAGAEGSVVIKRHRGDEDAI